MAFGICNSNSNFQVFKNQALAVNLVANERKIQSKQTTQLANLKAKQAQHARFQQSYARKLLRLKEAMKIAEAGGIPKGFEGKYLFLFAQYRANFHRIPCVWWRR